MESFRSSAEINEGVPFSATYDRYEARIALETSTGPSQAQEPGEKLVLWVGHAETEHESSIYFSDALWGSGDWDHLESALANITHPGRLSSRHR